MLGLLPHDESIPSSNKLSTTDRKNIPFVCDAFISQTPSYLPSIRKKSTVHTTRTPTVEGGFNVSSKFWIGLLSKNASFMVKHLKSPKSPQENLPEIAKVEILLADHLKVQHVADSAKLGLKGRVCWRAGCEGSGKRMKLTAWDVWRLTLTREQRLDCHWLFQCFFYTSAGNTSKRLGIYAIILMEHPLRKPDCNAETSKSTHAHSWIFSKKTASSGPTVTSHKHLKLFYCVLAMFHQLVLQLQMKEL